MIYLELLWSFLQIGLFSIGGGYAAMPLIQTQVVDLHPWLTMSQFADIMTVAEMTPGPIAINAATFVGIRVGGIPGALIATIGCVIPSCLIVMLLAFIYYRFRGLTVVRGILAGLRPAVIAMIASAGISLLITAVWGQRSLPADLTSADLIAVGIFIIAFLLLRLRKTSPIAVIFFSGLLGILCYSVSLYPDVIFRPDLFLKEDDHLLFTILALVILLLFYGCYFTKMLLQRRQGVRTDHLGKGKKGTEQVIEILLKITSYLLPAAEILSVILHTSMFTFPFRAAGAALGGAGAVIFIISVYTMKDNWRAGVSPEEKTDLVTGGIFRFSRNPAFLGFDLVYIGIMLLFSNIPLIILTLFTIVIFHLQIVKVEEPFLEKVFGERYQAYRKKTGRYLGRSLRK